MSGDIHIFANKEWDTYFANKNEKYDSAVKISKDLHQKALKNGKTDLTDFNEWLLIQFCLTQESLLNGDLKWVGEKQ